MLYTASILFSIATTTVDHICPGCDIQKLANRSNTSEISYVDDDQTIEL